MDVDILKPDTGYLSIIERPHYSNNSSTRGHTPSTSRDTFTPADSNESHSPVVGTGYMEPLSEGEDEDEVFVPAHDEGKRTGLSGAEVKAAIAYREHMLKERRQEEEEERKRRKRQGKEKQSNEDEHDAEDSLERDEPVVHTEAQNGHTDGQAKRQRLVSQKSTLGKKALSINPLAPSTAFDETLKTKLEGEERRQSQRSTSRSSRTRRSRSRKYGQRNDQTTNDDDDEQNPDEREEEEALGGPQKRDGDDRILERNWRAPPGKKIAIPVRIEPKVYFAAERTFLVSFAPYNIHHPKYGPGRHWGCLISPSIGDADWVYFFSSFFSARYLSYFPEEWYTKITPFLDRNGSTMP